MILPFKKHSALFPEKKRPLFWKKQRSFSEKNGPLFRAKQCRISILLISNRLETNVFQPRKPRFLNIICKDFVVIGMLERRRQSEWKHLNSFGH